MFFASNFSVQPFSQKSRTRTTVAKEFQSGLYDPAEADFELFCNCCSAAFLGDRLYYCTVRSRYKRIVEKRIWVASLPFQSLWATIFHIEPNQLSLTTRW